jgi:hypothetical protein
MLTEPHTQGRLSTDGQSFHALHCTALHCTVLIPAAPYSLFHNVQRSQRPPQSGASVGKIAVTGQPLHFFGWTAKLVSSTQTFCQMVRQFTMTNSFFILTWPWAGPCHGLGWAVLAHFPLHMTIEKE